MIWTAIAALLMCTAVVLLYGARVARLGRFLPERLGPSPGSALFPARLVEAFYWALHAPGNALIRLRVDPDTITYASLALSLGSAPVLAGGHFGWGALLVLAGGALDALDGMVARARGRASRAGAVLDSFVDRLADAAPLAGLCLFYRGSAVGLSVLLGAMIASSLMSYARAKADIYGLTLPSGAMRRHERIAYLAGSLLLAPLWPEAGGVAYPVPIAGAAVIAVAGLVASIQLITRIRSALGR